MIPLRVIDTDFTFYGEVPKYESLQITNDLFGIGSIDLKINRYLNSTDLLQMAFERFKLCAEDNRRHISLRSCTVYTFNYIKHKAFICDV